MTRLSPWHLLPLAMLAGFLIHEAALPAAAHEAGHGIVGPSLYTAQVEAVELDHFNRIQQTRRTVHMLFNSQSQKTYILVAPDSDTDDWYWKEIRVR